jgi:hypothetical protein
MHTTAIALVSAWAAVNLALAIAVRADRVTAAVFALGGAVVAVGEVAGPLVLVTGLGVSMCGPLVDGRRVLQRHVWWHHAVRGALLIGLGALYFWA